MFFYPFLHSLKFSLFGHRLVYLGAEIKGNLVGVGIKPDRYEEKRLADWVVIVGVCDVWSAAKAWPK